MQCLLCRRNQRREPGKNRRLSTFFAVGALEPLRVRREREGDRSLLSINARRREREEKPAFSSPWSWRGSGRPCWRHCPCPARSRGLRRPLLLERERERGEERRQQFCCFETALFVSRTNIFFHSLSRALLTRPLLRRCLAPPRQKSEQEEEEAEGRALLLLLLQISSAVPSLTSSRTSRASASFEGTTRR